jgi:hypothetical protein
MLQIHPDKVCLIIANAKEFQAQVGRGVGGECWLWCR